MSRQAALKAWKTRRALSAMSKGDEAAPKQRISGTREWATSTCNGVTGCEHGCYYCYQRWKMVKRFKSLTAKEWVTPRVRQKDVRKRREKEDGIVMFPSTHDITPAVLGPCMTILRNLINAGNTVLIVSKPHLECIQEIIWIDKEGVGVPKGSIKENCMFRFTIGARDNGILKTWEPGAPSFQERLKCLRLAHENGYRTSVSCEPLLDVGDVENLVEVMEPYVSDSIWIGKMNKIDSRVDVRSVPRTEINRIKAGQTDEVVRSVYEKFKNHPLIRWKESYKEVLGLALAEEAGLDV